MGFNFYFYFSFLFLVFPWGQSWGEELSKRALGHKFFQVILCDTFLKNIIFE